MFCSLTHYPYNLLAADLTDSVKMDSYKNLMLIMENKRIMKVAVFGSGYVGLVTGSCLANVGNQVICVDVDENKIECLQQGDIPIYEPGLDQIVLANVANQQLSFTTDAESAIKQSDIIFIAVGTPPSEDGSADLKYVLAVAETVGQHMDQYKVVVGKSTVPVGTCR